MAAFDIPLSGLEANSSWLNTISNNLANLNTDGYKTESVNFSDIFNQMQGTSGNGDPIQYGSGVEVGSTTANFSDGNVNSTGVAANMALQGNGFFVVQGSAGRVLGRKGWCSTSGSRWGRSRGSMPSTRSNSAATRPC